MISHGFWYTTKGSLQKRELLDKTRLVLWKFRNFWKRTHEPLYQSTQDDSLQGPTAYEKYSSSSNISWCRSFVLRVRQRWVQGMALKPRWPRLQLITVPTRHVKKTSAARAPATLHTRLASRAYPSLDKLPQSDDAMVLPSFVLIVIWGTCFTTTAGKALTDRKYVSKRQVPNTRIHPTNFVELEVSCVFSCGFEHVPITIQIIFASRDYHLRFIPHQFNLMEWIHDKEYFAGYLIIFFSTLVQNKLSICSKRWNQACPPLSILSLFIRSRRHEGLIVFE